MPSSTVRYHSSLTSIASPGRLRPSLTLHTNHTKVWAIHETAATLKSIHKFLDLENSFSCHGRRLNLYKTYQNGNVAEGCAKCRRALEDNSKTMRK